MRFISLLLTLSVMVGSFYIVGRYIHHTSKQSHSVWIAAGKSGGHILPALVIAEHEKALGNSITFFATTSPLDKQLLQNAAGLEKVLYLPLAAAPKNWLSLPWWLVKATFVITRVLITCALRPPLKVITTGGMVGMPVCLVARLFSIPFQLVELNVEPGRSIEFLAPYADTVHICFPQTKELLPVGAACAVSDYPLRFSSEQCTLEKTKARELLQLPKDATVIALLGGSQGSAWLNDAGSKALCALQKTAPRPYVVLHQAGGHADIAALQKRYNHAGVQAQVFAYHDDLAPLYRAADLLIARAGAGTLFEAKACHTPLLAIPLETRETDHQKANAYALAELHPERVKVLIQKEAESDSELFQTAIRSMLNKHSVLTGQSPQQEHLR
jgi:UDP-N-acetylglucosamine--N-acetylmuramyl-(pentapeptide) pyrophosphoryl-undecaprenol N-acetylglucosamine transferase